MAEHPRRPQVYYPCHYSTRKGSNIPLPIRSSASNLLRLLILTRPGTSMVGEDIPFAQPVGWGVRVRVGHKTWDRYQQPLPDDPRLQPSVIRAVLRAFPSESLQSAVSSAQWLADREEQHSTPVGTGSRTFTNGPPVVSSASSRHGIGECVVGRATPVVGNRLDQMAPTTADDGGRCN
jgi:hypothetical protein